MHSIIVSKKNPLDKNVPVPYSTYYMAKTIHDLEQEHFHHKLATFAVIFFLVFLSFIVLVFSLQPKDERAQSLQTRASETKPTPPPSSCQVNLKDIAYKLSVNSNCKAGYVLGAQFTCTNGYVGELNDSVCQPQSDMKDFANSICLFRSTCDTTPPKAAGFGMLKDTSCKINQSKTIVLKCDDGTGSTSWAYMTRGSCQTKEEWQTLVRTSDVCSSRRTPWTAPIPTDYPRPTVGPTWTPTPPYYGTPSPFPTKYFTPTPTAYYVTPTPWATWTPTPTPWVLP